MQGLRLPQLSLFSLDRLYAWVWELQASLDEKQMEFVRDYLTDMETKISRFLKVCLLYTSSLAAGKSGNRGTAGGLEGNGARRRGCGGAV